MGPKVKKEGERDKLTNCAQCSAVFSSKDAEKHSIECCEAIRTRRFGDCLSQFSHGFIAGEVFLLQIIEEATNVPSKSTDFPSIRLSVATMKQSGIGVGDAVWLQFANGTKSVAVVEPAADPMAIFTCSLRPKVISNGCVMMRKSDCPTAVAKEIKIELSEEKSFKDDLVFHRFIILKLLDRPVYLGQIVVVNYFAQRVKVELKAVVTEENDTEAISDRLTAVSLVDSNDSAVNVTPIKFRPDVNFSSTPAVVKIRSTEPSEQLYWITDKTTISTGNQETTEDRMTFDQIGGCFNAKKDLKLFLIDPLRISGVAQCSSFLLHGVSGTGKTLLGKSLRYETDLTAHFVTPSDEDVKAKVTGWLKNSRQSTLIVADNFDGFLEAKGKDSNLQSFWCSTLDSLRGTRVIFVAITNRLENVDSRLRSRFDVEVEVMVPNEVERKDILSRLLNAFDHCLSDSDCEIVSGKAHGYTGADLNAVCRQAASVAFRKNSRICIQDLLDSLTRVRPSAMKEVTLEIPKVYWSDIGGMEDVKLKLNQSVEWPLKHRESFRRLGIKPPVGVLLYGPPGCSKTLIAKALATESGLNFLSIKGPEVFSKWVGDSEKAIRDIFRKARQAAPCVIFFDEIDSLAASRSSGNGQAVGDRVLTQMLTEIDGIEGLENVIILAATNRPDTIDSALLRPGRLDRLVYVPLPDARARREIFGIRLRQTPADPDVNLDELVGATEGFSGAEVVVVCNEAALEAMMESVGITTVAMRHFRKALSDAKPRTDQTLLSLYERFKAVG